MKYKALFLDVDGTLIPNYSAELPSARVCDAIAKARNAGVHVGIVTGRPMQYLHHIFDHLQLDGPSIIVNGTQIVDSITRKLLYEDYLSQEDIQAIQKILRRFGNRIVVQDNGFDVPFNIEGRYTKPYGMYVEALPTSVANALVEELSAIPTVHASTMLAMEDEEMDVWVSHSGGTKQHGILEAARMLGINTNEIVGIGDGPNDFPLMMACGLKIAMGNAIEDLKTIADFVAPRVDEDGVAVAIEKFVLPYVSS